MKIGIIFVFLLAIPQARSCDCGETTVKEAQQQADIVFRGTLTHISHGMAYFHVVQVWKGHVAVHFKMPAFRETTFCVGFWPSQLEVGNDLLVYANWWKAASNKKEGDYFSNICTRTRLAREATEDFKTLGKGNSPE